MKFNYSMSLIKFCLFYVSLSLISLLLTRIGIYDGLAAVSISVLITLTIGKYLIDASKDVCLSFKEMRDVFPSAIAVAVVSVASVISFPIYDLPDRDPGIYTIISAVIARHGSVFVDNFSILKILSLFDGQIQLNKLGGVYSAVDRGLSDNPAHRIAQFNHLTPAIRALGFQYFGVQGLPVVSALFAAVASVGVVLLARQLNPSRWALLAGVLVVTNAAFVWTSRSVLTEVYTLSAVLFAAIFGNMLLRRGGLAAGILCGLFVGLAMLSRADAYIVTVFVVCLVGVWLIDEAPVPRRGISVFLAISSLFLVLSVVDLRTYSRPYFDDLFNKDLDLLIGGGAALLMLSWAILLLAPVLRSNDAILRWTRRLADVAVPALFIIGAAVFLIMYARSFFADLDIARSAVGWEQVLELQKRFAREMTWYVPLPIFLAGFAGMWIAVRDRDGLRNAPIAIFATITLIMFLINPSIYPDHPWASRRLVAYTIPLFLVFSVVWIAWLTRKYSRIGLPVLAFGVGVYALSQYNLGHAWYFAKIKNEIPDEYQTAYEEIKAEQSSIYVFKQYTNAFYMKYVHGLPSVGLAGGAMAPARDRAPWLAKISDLKPICITEIVRFYGYHSSLRQRLFGGPSKLSKNCVKPRVYQVVWDGSTPGIISSAYRKYGKHIDFRDSDANRAAYLRDGWSIVESWGVWSNAKQSAIEVKLPGRPPRDVVLYIRGRALVIPKQREQRILIYADDKQIGEWRITQAKFHRPLQVTIPRTHIARNGKLIIKFKFPNALSPKDAGLSSDGRILALGLSKIWVELQK